MCMGCKLMNEVKIIDVDENGNVIESINWDLWIRVRVEEVYDTDGAVTQIISHCVQKSIEQVCEELSQEARNNLIATDYISAKVGDAILECTTANEIVDVLSKYRAKYIDVIENRKIWREQVNNPFST